MLETADETGYCASIGGTFIGISSIMPGSHQISGPGKNWFAWPKNVAFLTGNMKTGVNLGIKQPVSGTRQDVKPAFSGLAES